MALLLGIDLGTSYFKVGLFTPAGELRGLGRVAVSKTTPLPGRCELAVEEFWAALRRGLSEALARARASAGEIVALSYASQASTFLLLDANDAPLTPLIVWSDARGEPVEPRLAAFAQTEAFRAAIGFEGISGQSAPTKWRWFAREAPELWARTRRIMTLSDYFTFALTGERAGDASTAAFLAIYDLPHDRWWPEALREFGVAAERLSTPLRPGTPCGRTTARAAELLGVGAGIPFAVGALDHHAAAIGSGLGRFAEASISTGTVLAALTLVETPRPRAGCFHGRHSDGARCWRLAFDANGASQLEEFQRRHAPEKTIEELLALAARAPAGAAWRTPWPAETGAAVRAVLERISGRHGDPLRRVGGEHARPVTRVAATGGGARSPLWSQINADLLGVSVVTAACPEPACLGAAAFAAVAARCYANISEAAEMMVRPARSFEPDPRAGKRYRELGV